MAGARPPGHRTLPLDMYNDDEEENSADSVEQAALEGAHGDESLLDPDSLMFEELDDDNPRAGGDDDDEGTVGRGRRAEEFDDQPVSAHARLFGENKLDTILNSPYGSPSDLANYCSNREWIDEMKKMLLEDQREHERRQANAPPIERLPPLKKLDELLAEEGIHLPTAEELAEKYSNEIIEKNVLLMQKDKRISNLEKEQRNLNITLEDCQKELRVKTEMATTGVEKLKRTLEEKDKCIMETSEKLRRVMESYNSSEKRWKEQEDYLEKQIHKLKSELQETTGLSEQVEKITEASRQEKETLEKELEEAREEIDLLKQQFSQEKKQLEEELQELRDEKSVLETQLREEIEVLQTRLTLSEQAVETALTEKETFRAELESQEEKNRILSLDVVELNGKNEIISQQESEKLELERIIANLRQEVEEKQERLAMVDQERQAEKETLLKEMEEKQEQFAAAQRELQHERESMRKEMEEAKQQLEAEDSPVNFFKQNNDASATESWTDTQKSLEDRIAELELEKGNLLLQLVDVDEHEQQEAEKSAAITAVAEENAKQLESMKESLDELRQKHEVLEKELEETKSKEFMRIETAMNTIAWEEKYEELQKENQSLMNDLHAQRQAADELSGRYEELEKKCSDLELGKPPIEGIVEIDKCDGWSDGTPALPDEGFTEMEAQISELKAALDEKQRQLDEMLLVQKDAEDKLVERNLMVSQYEARIEEISTENNSCKQKLEEYVTEITRLQVEIAEKQEAEAAAASSETVDGWANDPPVLLDEGFNEDNQVVELKQELSKKNEELSTATEKCKLLEEKYKKALKALKQKNERLAEMKNRLGDDSMNTSVASMETSVALEPLVGRSMVSDTSSSPTMHLELDRWRRDCEEREAKIKELEGFVKSLQDRQNVNEPLAAEQGADLANAEALLAQRDMEILNLRNELTQLASSLDNKNEEVVQLMKTCEEMQKSVDEKVELLNDCVSKKDVEVRQAISQYEDFLKDATLNVSHLTKELEEKIREINHLQAQVQEAQEELFRTQNEYDSYKAEYITDKDFVQDKEQELLELKQVEVQLRDNLTILQVQLGESYNSHSAISEALDRAEAEKKQMREESVCIQNEYGNKNKELQVQISQLIDQLNERESAISVMEARLKESDEVSDKMTNDIRFQLEEKSKALEQAEQSLFVKTEDCVRLEERIRETEANYRREMDSKLFELQEQHRMSLEAYAAQTSDDLERTCEQLAKKNSEVTELQEQCRQLQEQLARIEGDYSSKCSELSQAEHLVTEINTLKATIQGMEGSINSYTHALNNANVELNAKNDEIKNLQTICGQYEEKCYNSAVAQEGVQRSLQETQSALAQCQQDLGTYYNELQNSKMEAEALRNSQGEYHQTIDRLNTELNEAKTETARHATEIQNMTNQLAKYQDIEANLNRYLEDLNGATEELGKRNSEYRELEKTCKAQEVQIQSLQANAETSRAELSQVQQMLAEKDGHISKLEYEAQTLRANSQQEEANSEKTKELLDELEEKNREISDLRFELEEGIIQEKRLKENLDSREKEIKQLRYEMSEKDQQIEEAWQTLQTVQNVPLEKEEDGPLLDRLSQADRDREALERKIDLLHSKLEEVEASEVKCYEDSSRLKILRTELEMDNLRMSSELEQLRRSIQAGDNDPKYKSMENQLILMTKTLEDRDKLCRDLMKNISELQENYDGLRIRVNSMTLPQPFALSPDSLEARFVEQDREIFSLRVDLEREKKIRELYEGQLFLATSKKQFENSTRKSNSSGSWFGLGELFSSPPPPMRPSPSPSTRSSVSTSVHARPRTPSAQSYEPYAPSPGRPVTPITPAMAMSPSVFDTSGIVGQGQQYFVPQMVSPGPSSGEGAHPAQSPATHVVESPYAMSPIMKS